MFKSALIASTLLWISLIAHSFETVSPAEWLQAKEILMHTPQEELFLGLIHPSAALFERPFFLGQAQKEHQKFIQLLRGRGIHVHTLVEILLSGTLDKKGLPLQGKALNELREFAANSLYYDLNSLTSEQKVEQEKYKQEVLIHLHPHELVRIIFQRPTVKLKTTGAMNTGWDATYELDPVMNMYFMRDQMITTAEGVIICKMNSPQRNPETSIAKFALKKLSIPPLYEIQGEGRLEGGDFIPAGENALIGQGLRTNAEAIKQLLEKKLFGSQRVIVIKDTWFNQEQMHLDTYFNILGNHLAVLSENRLDKGANPLTVDIYEMIKGVYVKTISDAPFQKTLTETFHYKILPVSREDQLKYGINFLSVKDRHIIGIDGVSQSYKELLKKNGVKATWIDYSNLTGGYGAAHCSTQVLLRRGPPSITKKRQLSKTL